jgi:hypothetical protein
MKKFLMSVAIVACTSGSAFAGFYYPTPTTYNVNQTNTNTSTNNATSTATVNGSPSVSSSAGCCGGSSWGWGGSKPSKVGNVGGDLVNGAASSSTSNNVTQVGVNGFQSFNGNSFHF